MNNEFLFEKKLDSKEIIEIINSIKEQYEKIDPSILANGNMDEKTTILEWMDNFDITEVNNLGKYINSWFMLNISESEWKQILEPVEIKTIFDVTEFIRLRGKTYEFKDYFAFGRACRTAGIFLTLKSVMQKKGINVEKIKPSTLISEITKENIHEFIETVNLLSPNKLPKIEIKLYKIAYLGTYGVGISVVMGIINSFAKNIELFTFTITILIASFLYSIFIAGKIPLKEVKMGEIKTVRDLVVAIESIKK